MEKLTMREQVLAFNESWHSIERLYAEYAKSAGLTYMSLTILDIIASAQGVCTQKMICEQIMLPKQSVNTMIKSFLDQGIIRMKELPADRRNKEILLSAKGKKYAAKIIGPLRDAEQHAVQGIPAEQRQMLVDLSRQVARSLRTQLQKGKE